jgi:hypothetical protein
MGPGIFSGWLEIHVGYYRRALEIDRLTVPLAWTVDGDRWLTLGYSGFSSVAQGPRLERLVAQFMRRSRRTCARCVRWTARAAAGAWCGAVLVDAADGL